MKKFKSIFFKICIVACMVLSIFATSVVDASTYDVTKDTSSVALSIFKGFSSSSDMDLTPENYSPGDGEIDNVVVTRYGTRLFNFLYVIAVIVSVIMLMYVGLKYIVGSVSEKAEYKKNLIPMAVGALLVTFLLTIIRMVINTAQSI